MMGVMNYVQRMIVCGEEMMTVHEKRHILAHRRGQDNSFFG